jgi:hypothetical protein
LPKKQRKEPYTTQQYIMENRATELFNFDSTDVPEFIELKNFLESMK